MKFGVNVLNFGPAATPDAPLAWVRMAEELGYGFAMISDHVAITPDVYEMYPTPFYDPLVVLGQLAAATESLELGTSVLVLPYRHPLLVARMVASLDQLSKGRMILGVGTGWSPSEFAALGVAFDRRGAISDEYLAVITEAWRTEQLTFHGEFIDFEDIHTGPGPAGGRALPVWVGGNGVSALRRAARFGAAWHPMDIPIGWLKKEGMPMLQRIADELGVPCPPLAPRLHLGPTRTPLPDDARILGMGSIDQICADVEEVLAFAPEYVMFDSYVDALAEQPQGPNEHRAHYELVSERILQAGLGIAG